jgi:hypothetical protein
LFSAVVLAFGREQEMQARRRRRRSRNHIEWKQPFKYAPVDRNGGLTEFGLLCDVEPTNCGRGGGQIASKTPALGGPHSGIRNAVNYPRGSVHEIRATYWKPAHSPSLVDKNEPEKTLWLRRRA